MSLLFTYPLVPHYFTLGDAIRSPSPNAAATQAVLGLPLGAVCRAAGSGESPRALPHHPGRAERARAERSRAEPSLAEPSGTMLGMIKNSLLSTVEAWPYQVLRKGEKEQLSYEERACEGGRFAAVEVVGKPFDEASKEGVLKLLKDWNGHDCSCLHHCFSC
ncbi:heme-binding protein 1 isoform X2 [Lathamus discolor]|uniref:heme-binding protein 1 isoform X2 n=1 Tax=Lathamus discolor TaxID=678569 RepID=UPI0032B87A30